MRKRHALTALLAATLALPAVRAQDLPAEAPAAAASAPVPANAGTPAVDDSVDLDDIRNFSRVYAIVRQAYVEKVDNRTLMKAAISGMLAGLDPHSEYLDREGLDALTEDTTGAYGGLGVEVMQTDGELRVIAPIDDTPAARAGIKPGDIIIKVDGKLVDPEAVNNSIQKLRGDPGTKIQLTVVHEHSDKPVDLTLTRERISVASVKLRELQPGYVYIRISQFQEDTAADLDRKLSELIQKHGTQHGAILDLRSNPGGLLNTAVGVSDAFLDGGRIVATRGRLDDSNLTFDAHAGDLLHGAPMVVLVDNGTASAAEIVSGALKDHHRAVIMGRRTFGKGVVQTVIPLDSTHAVKLTTARYYTPNGTSIQAEGIDPDIGIPDLVANKAQTAPSLIGSEADLPHHLANEEQDADAADAHPGQAADDLAEKDYALAAALNVLKGLALSHRPSPSPTAH